MKFWVDAQLSPALAPWLRDTFGVEAFSVRWLGLQHASDEEIFVAAREAEAVVITKDRDFVRLLEKFGPPPKLIWVTCGNTSNAQMRKILRQAFPETLLLLQADESLVEITNIS
jgi:predicted nuclease of predicted toxin-antitoxin system